MHLVIAQTCLWHEMGALAGGDTVYGLPLSHLGPDPCSCGAL